MGDWSQYADWLLQQHGYIVYLILTALLLSGSIGLPIPEDIPLIIAGVLVQRGNAQLELAFAVCYGAVLLGDMMIFLVGYRLGPSLFKTSLLSARFTPEFVQRISVSMERHALVMIFLARHLFYLRTATFLTCGAFRMGFLRFMAADALAALISAPLMMGVGYLAAEHLPYAFEMMKKAKTVSIILGLGAVGFVIVMVLRYEKKTT